MKRAIAVALLALAGCAQPDPLPADPKLQLDPIQFFAGSSEGTATLEKIFSEPEPVRVASGGVTDKAGRLILHQIIQEGDKPSRKRRWIMQRVSAGRYTGSLTDATGPVAVRTSGPRAFIDYRMKNGMDVHQELALQTGGKVVLNRLTVSKFGIRLAQLDETIRKSFRARLAV